MKNAKIKERDIWADMFRNPEDHKKAFEYVLLSVLLIGFIVAIRLLA